MNRTQRITPQAIAQALLRDVYYPISACVWLGAEGDVVMIRLFDTAFAPLPEYGAPAAQAWLISSHPDGDMRPGERDRANFRALALRSGGMGCRLYIASEDFGVTLAEETNAE